MNNPEDYEGIKITYFVPDERKAGGKYVGVVGTIHKIDKINRSIVLEDRTILRISDIADVEPIKCEY